MLKKIISGGQTGADRAALDATRILNALKGNDFYDGDPEKLADYKPQDIRKINGLGMKSVYVIAKALESIGVIGDAEEWLRG